MSRRPATLFRRTAVTLSLAFVLLLLVVFGTLVYFVNLPLARQATDDLAALIVLSAQTWVELPPATRADFERELIEHHGLVLQAAETPLPEQTSILPYRRLLEQALEKRLGHTVTVKTTEQPNYYWVDIPMGGQHLRVGFAHDRVGIRPPYAFSIIFLTMLVLVIVTAMILARRIAGPLVRMAGATQAVGQGSQPQPLPETGPAELAALAQAFNRMAGDVRELLANRTTLLAGVSHDLRTPLARMRLAVEMLPPESDPKLVAGLVRDLDVMDTLLTQYLALAGGMIDEVVEALDLRELLDGLVADARRAGATITWTPNDTPVICTLRPHAFERIITNLLDNARRYGGSQPTEVECLPSEGTVVINILDRGPGIPAAEREAVFRPFHRLKSSPIGGSGLGLAIARKLAEANGWQISLADRPGGGSIACLRLPCDTPDRT
ncbi:MAG: HAMP domain-containing protein [Gammaproteobacteria bacterium]|nr:HAMP domain-containing protein [Gammaproteobacteria bacterium]